MHNLVANKKNWTWFNDGMYRNMYISNKCTMELKFDKNLHLEKYYITVTEIRKRVFHQVLLNGVLVSVRIR